MQAMQNALDSGKAHLDKSEEAHRTRSSASRASSAGPATVKSDDDLYNILGGPSAPPENKKRKLEMLEAVAAKFRK